MYFVHHWWNGILNYRESQKNNVSFVNVMIKFYGAMMACLSETVQLCLVAESV